MKRYDIAVVGGGASGLAAAISAKRLNSKLSVAVVERLQKTGKKLLATGNGRCNLSNADLSTAHYHGSCLPLLAETAAFDAADFFAGLGVLCDDDGYGRIYPRCRTAASVLDALRLGCAGLGVEEVCGFEVTGIEAKNGFILQSPDGALSAKSVILAGGGKSQSVLGSNGSLLGICRSLGIAVNEPFPALVPLKTDPTLVKPLKGQRADANVSYFADGSLAASERGEVQFTDGLLSGICVFDLSYLYSTRGRSELRLDLLPDMSGEEVRRLLGEVSSIRSGAPAEDYLSGIFTRPMGIYLLKRAVGKLPGTAGELNARMLTKTADTIKSLSFPVTGTAGFDRSQVTGGGIAYDELAPGFGLRRFPGMYACGELLDIYGDCGGYNLNFAFASGAAAGRNAAYGLCGRI